MNFAAQDAQDRKKFIDDLQEAILEVIFELSMDIYVKNLALDCIAAAAAIATGKPKMNKEGVRRTPSFVGHFFK